MDRQQQQHATGLEHATQSTNPFSTDKSSYQEHLRAVLDIKAPQIPAQVSTDKLEAVTSCHTGAEQQQQQQDQQTQQHNDPLSNLRLPDCFSELQLDKKDKSTRLLLLPSDPNSLELESIGLSGGGQRESALCGEWMQFAFGGDSQGGSIEMARVLAVAQSIHDIACKISISIGGSARIVFDIFFDPSTDKVTLSNNPRSTTIEAIKNSGKQKIIVYPAVTAELDPGVWDLVAPAVSCSNKLFILPRRFLPEEASTCELSKAKRASPSSTVGHASKRVRDAGGEIHNLHVERIPHMRQSPHPLMSLLPSQTIKVIGGNVHEEYSVTRVQKLSENRASSVWRALVSIFRSEKTQVVAKTLLKGRHSTLGVAEMWLREAKIHSKLNSQTSDRAVTTIVRLLGLDARLHSLYVEDINAPSLAQRDWRRTDNYFSGSLDDADRVLRDISSALDHVHGKGVVHNDIKPGNILYSTSRGAVLIDFGLSSDGEQDSARVSMAGTPWYIPPEFSTGRRSRGFPGDVWALGVVMLFLYQLLPLPERTTEWMIAEVGGPNHKALARMLEWIETTKRARAKLGHTATDEIIRKMTEINPVSRVGIRGVVEALESWK